MDFIHKHEGISAYLDYVENTESPRLFHVWCLVSGISAALGRRCWLPSGIGNVWPNMYIILSGPPAARKSAALGYIRRLLLASTGVRFAPDDTGGARQGLIASMNDIGEDENEDEKRIIEALAEVAEATNLSELSRDKAATKAVNALGDYDIDLRDPRSMYIVASELNSFLGENNTQMLTFLQVMYDSEKPYKYRLKGSELLLKDAVLNILGATTPTQIALALPGEATGQGFMSRIIFVYGAKHHARIPRPSLNEPAGEKVKAILSDIFHKFNGPFSETDKAAKLHDDIYMRGTALKDPRFVNYCDRRLRHMEKISMALAACRGSMIIDEGDVGLADQLLTHTELTMSDALGEYGMNKLGAAKQRLLETVIAATEPIPTRILYAMLNRDMSQVDFRTAINELHNAKKLSILDVSGLGQCVIAVADTEAKKARQQLNELDQLLTVKPPQKAATA